MSSTRRLLLLALTAILIGRYYYWMSRATGGRFAEVRDLNGFYDMLGRALLKGQLHLDIRPAPEMLALPNPWDPDRNLPWRLQDAALYNGRYYVYHGVIPAVILFAPWRALTGYDLPQHFGLFLIVSAGALFWLAAVGRIAGLRRLSVFAAIAIGLASGVPYLLNRIDVYEIAIAGGFLCLGAAVFFLTGRSYGLAGLCFGMAAGCRPHLGLVGCAVFVWLLTQRRAYAELARYAGLFVAVLVALCWYNYARFGNPLEFGVRYLLADQLSHQHVRLSPGNLIASGYYYLFCPPDLQPVFPWLRSVMRLPAWLQFPPNYFLEATTGVLFFAPVCLLAWRARGLAGYLAASAVGLLLFHLLTGFTTQRYFVDFVPLLIFAAAVSKPGRLFAVLAVYGAAANMLVALEGPWHDYLRNRPESYLRLARTFSFSPRYQPVANPPLDVTLQGQTEPMPDGLRQPLLSLGRDARRYLLYIEHEAGKIRVVSASDESRKEIAGGLPETAPLKVHVALDRQTQTMRISVNDAPAADHRVGLLISAPAQIRVGENDPYDYSCKAKFVGSIGQIPR
jgi:hypothetical protein